MAEKETKKEIPGTTQEDLKTEDIYKKYFNMLPKEQDKSLHDINRIWFLNGENPYKLGQSFKGGKVVYVGVEHIVVEFMDKIKQVGPDGKEVTKEISVRYEIPESSYETWERDVGDKTTYEQIGVREPTKESADDYTKQAAKKNLTPLSDEEFNDMFNELKDKLSKKYPGKSDGEISDMADKIMQDSTDKAWKKTFSGKQADIYDHPEMTDDEYLETAEHIVENFINGNITYARNKIGNDIGKLNECIDYMEEMGMDKEEIGKFRRSMTLRANLKQATQLPPELFLNETDEEVDGVASIEVVDKNGDIIFGPADEDECQRFLLENGYKQTGDPFEYIKHGKKVFAVQHLDGAKFVKYDEMSGYTYAWFGGHGVHVYTDDGKEVDYFSVGSFANDNATYEEVKESVEEHIKEQDEEEINGNLKQAEEGYQGWSNRETWGVNLWLDNDQRIYNDVLDIVKQGGESYEVGDRIKDYIESIQPDLGATLWGDLLNWSLQEVNWREIAESWIEDNKPADVAPAKRPVKSIKPNRDVGANLHKDSHVHTVITYDDKKNVCIVEEEGYGKPYKATVDYVFDFLLDHGYTEDEAGSVVDDLNKGQEIKVTGSFKTADDYLNALKRLKLQNVKIYVDVGEGENAEQVYRVYDGKNYIGSYTEPEMDGSAPFGWEGKVQDEPYDPNHPMDMGRIPSRSEKEIVDIAKSSGIDLVAEIKDNYGNPVPGDLVCLSELSAETHAELIDEDVADKILSVDWYEVEGEEERIFVSWDQIKDFGFDFESDIKDIYGIDFSDPKTVIYKINPPLKRWSPEDGFYHA